MTRFRGLYGLAFIVLIIMTSWLINMRYHIHNRVIIMVLGFLAILAWTVFLSAMLLRRK